MPPKSPPSRSLLAELRVFAEIPNLALSFPKLAAQPRGNGRSVMAFPGFGAGDASTAVLRSYLRYLGYRARGWGIGLNNGDVVELIANSTAATERFAKRMGGPVSIVGWSLGGYLAREVARDRPEIVERIITLGSPIIGGPKYTAAAEFYRRQGYDLDRIEQLVEFRNQTPIHAPITALYSKSDAIVSWEACIDHHNDHVEHVEVEGSHLGLGFNASVYELIAQRLAL